MKTGLKLTLLLAASVAGPCWASESNTLSRSKQNLRAIWTATNATPQQRAAAINFGFTNGTRIRRILGVLGKWDEHHQRFLTTDPSERDYRWLVYRFCSERITLRANDPAGRRTDDVGVA